MAIMLGIESSCDETGIAMVADGKVILSNEVASQQEIHALFGGVVPEVASRKHLECITQLTSIAIEHAGARPDAIAATIGPGLMGSLLVGVNFAKSLAYAWDLPFIPVHHIEGHIFSVFLTERSPGFPFLSLVVSGGHTCLIWCPRPHVYALLGSTRDDAVGECFDKVARLLGLSYPGGPSIQRAAEQGDMNAFSLPRGLASDDGFDFSYSGLKTAVLYALRDSGYTPEQPPDDPEFIMNMAASFQHAAVDALLIKTQHALEHTGAERLVLAGGVAANRLLRDRLIKDMDTDVYLPPLALCLDNGAMIAAAGQSRLEHGCMGTMNEIPRANMSLV